MDWYRHWFETDYYYLLYRNRDQAEASAFIELITSRISLPPGAHVLDLACGRGRHSEVLAKLGYCVTGADLSLSSITKAKHKESDNLRFVVHDMREPLDVQFRAILNLFTSFGYFEDENDNLRVLKAVYQSLYNGGTFVLDYLNFDYTVQHLVPAEIRTIDGISFNITRKIEGNRVVKTIAVHDRQKKFTKIYTEKVSGFSLLQFQELFEKAGLKIKDVFGNYQLGPFNSRSSERLILIAEKL